MWRNVENQGEKGVASEGKMRGVMKESRTAAAAAGGHEHAATPAIEWAAQGDTMSLSHVVLPKQGQKKPNRRSPLAVDKNKKTRGRTP